MNSMRRVWIWLADSRNQKTLSFVGAGLVVVVGAGWQLYLHFGSSAQAPSKSVTAAQGGIAAGNNVTATAGQGGTAIIATGNVNVNNAPPKDASEILAQANALKEKAWAYERKNDLVNAELALKESIDVLRKGLGPESPNVARHLRYLASFYRQNDRRERFEPLAKEALSIDEKTLGPTDPELAAGLEYLASYYYGEKRFAESEPYFRRALTIREATERHDVPTTPNKEPLYRDRWNLAGIYYRTGRYPEAESLLDLSDVELSSALRDRKLWVTPELRQTLGALAQVRRDRSRYQESEDTYKRAVALYEQKYDSDEFFDKSAEFASTLEGYAELLRRTRRQPEATRLDARAKKLRSVARPERPYHKADEVFAYS